MKDLRIAFRKILVYTIPRPMEVYYREGRLHLIPPIKVYCEGIAEDILRPLREELDFWRVKYTTLSELDQTDIVVLTEEEYKSYLDEKGIVVPDRIGLEGYVIDVRPDRAYVIAKSEVGIFYGLQTLRQIIEVEEGKVVLPCLLVIDYPQFSFRGFTDDISRGPVPKLEFVERMIKLLAEFKLNAFTHYIELHAFEFPSHPDTTWQDYLTPSEVKAIVKLCETYLIDYFPSIQSFGHSRIVLSNPKYSHLAEFPGSSLLSPVKPEVYEFLKDVFRDVCKFFDSKYFNINCDETEDIGKGASREVCEKLGKEEVYLSHILKLREMLKVLGKTTMMWGDMLRKYHRVLNKVPHDIIVLNWNYSAKERFDDLIEPLWRWGIKQIVCPGIQCWGRLFPDYIEARFNISRFSRDGARYGAIGVLTTSWDDDGENLQVLNFYGILLAAEAAWCGSIGEDFNERFDWAVFRSRSRVGDAIETLSECVHRKLIGYTRSFWMNPFENISTLALMAEEGKKCYKLLKRAEEIIKEARQLVRRNSDLLDSIEFCIRRLRHVADKVISSYELVRAVETRKGVKEALDNCIATFRKLYEEISEIEDLHRMLWRRECKTKAFETIVRPRYRAYRRLIRDILERLVAMRPEDLTIVQLTSRLTNLTYVPYIPMMT